MLVLQPVDAVSQGGDLPAIQLQDKLLRRIARAIPNLCNQHLGAFTLPWVYVQVNSRRGL